MPRDGSGIYSLPAGNPVVTNTLIASTWANTTMSDIAAQLNNVFTRDGLLGPTGPFKIADGTVAAPGLAFNSEPGLGWYRPAAGQINMAQGGSRRVNFDLSTAASTNVSLLPGGGAAGVSTVALRNADGANWSQLFMQKQANNDATIGINAGGTGAAGTLFFSGATNYIFDNTVNGNGFRLNNYPNSSWYSSGGQTIFQYNANWYWSYNQSNGDLSWVRNGTTGFQLLGDGRILAGGNDFFMGNGSNMALQVNSGARVLRFTSDGWRLEWQTANGNLVYYNPSNNALFYWDNPGAYFRVTGSLSASANVDIGGTLGVNSNIVCNQAVFAGGSGSAALVGGGNPYLRWTGDNWRILWASGNVYFRNNSDTTLFQFNSDGTAWKTSAGNTWNNLSDARAKDVYGDYEAGLAEILQVNVRRFHYKDRPDEDCVGPIAQEIQIPFPETVRVMPDKMTIGGVELEDVLMFDASDITWALVNAVKTLDARLKALEAKP